MRTGDLLVVRLTRVVRNQGVLQQSVGIFTAPLAGLLDTK